MPEKVSLQTQLATLAAGCEKATPGPWKVMKHPDAIPASDDPGETVLYDGYTVEPVGNGPYLPIGFWEDAQFIATARTALPQLIQKCQQMQVALEAVRAVIDEDSTWKGTVERQLVWNALTPLAGGTDA